MSIPVLQLENSNFVIPCVSIKVDIFNSVNEIYSHLVFSIAEQNKWTVPHWWTGVVINSGSFSTYMWTGVQQHIMIAAIYTVFYYSLYKGMVCTELISFLLKTEVARSKGRVALTTNMVLGGTVTDDASDEWLVLDQKVCINIQIALLFYCFSLNAAEWT